MRWLTLLLQIAISGVIGLYTVMRMGLRLQLFGTRSEFGVVDVILYGGVVAGFATWLLGLIVDRASIIRLALTVAGAILALTVGYQFYEWVRFAEGTLVYKLMVFANMLAAPAGALAGYYWPWRQPHVEGQ
jgi:hypothetical protein